MNWRSVAITTSLAFPLFGVRDCCAKNQIREWTYRSNPPLGMTRAELHFKDVSTQVYAGVLVISPGMNGDGSLLLSDVGWVEFARRHNFLMVGLSFASEVEDLKNGKGYYYADKGSGKILLRGLSEAKANGLPLFMYGFSGGAHFTSRFVLWRPQQIGAWCAYSAAWWETLAYGRPLPPGIVACGERDFRIDSSMGFFERGRNVGAKWLWIGLRGVGHTSSPELESFFRSYVEKISGSANGMGGIWINIHTGREEDQGFAKRFPCAVGWLPEKSLLMDWVKVRGL